MQNMTALKRFMNAIDRDFNKEDTRVKIYLLNKMLDTYFELEKEQEINSITGKPFTSSENVRFTISIILEDVDTPLIIEEARKEIAKYER